MGSVQIGCPASVFDRQRRKTFTATLATLATRVNGANRDVAKQASRWPVGWFSAGPGSSARGCRALPPQRRYSAKPSSIATALDPTADLLDRVAPRARELARSRHRLLVAAARPASCAHLAEEVVGIDPVSGRGAVVGYPLRVTGRCGDVVRQRRRTDCSIGRARSTHLAQLVLVRRVALPEHGRRAMVLHPDPDDVLDRIRSHLSDAARLCR